MKVTLTLDDDVYAGLKAKAGARGMGKFISRIVRPHVSDSALEDGYKALAADTASEADAQEWLTSMGDPWQDMEPWEINGQDTHETPPR